MNNIIGNSLTPTLPYETGVYAVTSEGHLIVTNETRFGEIRRQHNPGTVELLYAEGW